MPSPPDRFAGFLSQLSRQLDDHDLRGSDLAARLFMSRSMLDRLVAAAAGETTARFRRRLLLERAAYRLRTSPIGILDAATEAGFSSAEAFTRAFRRAYGCPPSAWRTSAASFHLAAPNGIHFYPPGGLRLPATKRATTMTFVSGLVDHHVSVLGQLIDRAAALTDAQLDAPVSVPAASIDGVPTIRSLLSRLVGQLDQWNAAMASVPYDFAVEQSETIASMRVRLAVGGTGFAAYVGGAAEHDRFGETFVDATGDRPYVFTAAGMIAHVLTYAAYRRTLAVEAVAIAGAPDVDDDPLSWFAP